MPEWLITLLKIGVIVFGFVLGVSGMLTLLGDRKQSAKIQNRVGPNRAELPVIGTSPSSRSWAWPTSSRTASSSSSRRT
jgi:hypothetical protein